MAWQRDFIERKRRVKFSIGSSIKQPVAPDLHRSITNLSTELYQNDMHFIKEIIQNAEDNKYGAHVRPSLEFFLTSTDVAGMGVSATLLVLNNEEGLTSEDVDALCGVRLSTKKDKRDEGYIGCKGIGFKSVFMVCKTPVIISNGFRIRFPEDPSDEAGVGYIVPEWAESPTDDAILAVCRLNEVPATVIVLPLRHDKVDLVRTQLKEVSPENILFLSKIRELKVVINVEDEFDGGGLLRITRSEPISSIVYSCSARVSHVDVKVPCKLFKVNLTVECGRGEDAETFPYLVFRGLFPVSHPVLEREEVRDWAISLAFPQEGRASDHAGDIFSFLPTEQRTGFPFIVNADFILTSSRESIQLDSKWNLGILRWIPVAFESAFSNMLEMSSKLLSDRRDAYMFLPVNAVENAYRYSSARSVENRQVRQKVSVQPQQASTIQRLEKIRDQILQRVKRLNNIFLSSPGIDNSLRLSRECDLTAESCFLIKSSFRKILKSAAQRNHPAPSAVLEREENFSHGVTRSKNEFGIVDEYVQHKYSFSLAALGVSEMGTAQYESFLLDAKWLMNLPDKIYVQLLGFFASDWTEVVDNRYGDTFNLLKIRDSETSESLKLTSLASLAESKSELLYTSSVEDAEWIYAWVKAFSRWDSVEVMPALTSQALIEAGNSQELMTWMRKSISVTELSVRTFADRLIEKLTDTKSRKMKSSLFSVLVVQFLYCGIRDKKLSREFVVSRIKDLGNVIVFDGKSLRESSASSKMRKEGGLLLPSGVSKWPTLFTCCGSNSKHLITLSDMYMVPQCSRVSNVVTKTPGPDSMLGFIKEAFNAVDLPMIKFPAGESVTFCKPVTMERSLLMLEWLKNFLPSRTGTRRQHHSDGFLRSVKEFAWVKTYHHGWQLPTSVFFSIDYFRNSFIARDLPFLDMSAYADLDLTDDDAEVVFEELGLVTDISTGDGCAQVLKCFSSCLAKKLDLEAVSRFYAFLHEASQARLQGDIYCVKIWIPAGAKNEGPMWKDCSECVISDEHGICADINGVAVLDTIYDISLMPFFSKVQVPEKASTALHCKIWCEWSGVAPSKVKVEDGCTQNALLISRVKALKAHHVLKNILESWPDSRKDSSSADPQNEDAPRMGSQKDAKEEDEVWKSFFSRAWVPVAPMISEVVSEANKTPSQVIPDALKLPKSLSAELISDAIETISIVPPSQVLIADDLVLSKSFSAVAYGKLNLVWLPPGLSSEESAKLVKLYSKMGVRKLSELVKFDVRIPPDTWKKKVSRKKRRICEGLFRAVLAYLCKHSGKHNLSLEDRQQILLPLISATEVEVGEPLEKNLSLSVGMSTFHATVDREHVLAHYDKVKRKLCCLKKDHVLLDGVASKKMFYSQIVTTVSSGILSEHPGLVKGLTSFLLPLCRFGFSTKSVERKLQRLKLLISPEEEKLLMESIATNSRD